MLPWIFMQLNHWTVYYMTIHYKRQYEAILIDEELTFQGEMFLWRGMRLATYRSRGIMKLWVSSSRCLLSMASCTSVGLLVCTPCRSTMVETCSWLINDENMYRLNSLLEVFGPPQPSYLMGSGEDWPYKHLSPQFIKSDTRLLFPDSVGDIFPGPATIQEIYQGINGLPSWPGYNDWRFGAC